MKNWRIGKNILCAEGDYLVQSFLTVNEIREDGGFRIWYSRYSLTEKRYRFGYVDTDEELNILDNTIMQISSAPQKKGLHILGVPAHWQLIQPVHIRLDEKRERLYFWAHGEEGVCRFFAADSTDGINFQVPDFHRPCLYHPNDRAVPLEELKHKQLTPYCNRYAPADPDEPAVSADMLMNDATNVYRLDDGSFELYSAQVAMRSAAPCKKVPQDPLLRTVQRRTSADGIHWSKPQTVVQPDAEDAFDLQFYHLSVTHTPEGRIGMLGHYRSDPGTMDVEFCFSQDGITWKRERHPGFPRLEGVAGVYTPHSLLKKDDKYLIFYTGYAINHHGQYIAGGAPDTPKSWIGYAEIPCADI